MRFSGKQVQMRTRFYWAVSVFAVSTTVVVPDLRAQAPVSAAGQDPTHQHPDEARHYEGPPLALKDAVDEALAKNPELLALRAQLPVVRAKPAQERGLAPPMLEGTIWQWPINTLNPANTNMYMLMVGQELPGRGKRDLRAAVAEKDVALADSDVAVRARQIVDDVKQSYTTLFIARRAVDIHLANVDLLRQLADISQLKYTTGRISQQDVLKPVVELSKLHNDILMLDEQAGLATARLNILLDRAPDAAIGVLVDTDVNVSLPDTQTLQQLAIDHQPELQRARLEVERAEAELAAAKSAYKPDFTVQGGYLIMPNQTDALLARVGISWPRAPWSRGKVDAQVAEHAAMVDAVKAKQRAMENMVRLAVQEAYVRAKAAQDRAALLRTTILPQSQQTLDVSRVAYQTDRVDFQALIDNERTLLDAQLDYVRAQSEFEQATAELERAIGTDLPAATGAARRSAGGQR
jgi:cobalt-zinc-cadmium efflux system outer membrane protein